MIDLKAARAEPDTWRAALARKGAGEAFDELLAADEHWRALVPRVDDLRSRTKLKGKPTPEQLGELQRLKEELRAGRGSSSPLQKPPGTRRSRTCPTRRTTPLPTAAPRTTPSRSAASVSRPILPT